MRASYHGRQQHTTANDGYRHKFARNDSYTDIDVKDDKTLTLTTEALPLADEKCLDILSKNQDSIIPGLVAYFKQEGIPSQGGRGGNMFFREEGQFT